MSADFNVKSLRALLQAFHDIGKVRIGVLGAKDGRNDSQSTNAKVGAKHEFGLDGMPIRSFLRQPITEQMQKFLDQSGYFSGDAAKETMRTAIRDKSLDVILAKIGIVGEAIVQEGFASGGFGKWKPSNFSKKKVHQTLVETQQLRNSIGSEVAHD
jgi:hypothetical protein